jgi:hypothetical protein
MVSDMSLQELHEFAERLGIPPRGFHGDHYDLPQYMRDKAITPASFHYEKFAASA